MIEWHRYAIVGQVISDDGVFLYNGSEPYTTYTMRVSDVISGIGLAAGNEILMVVPGGQRANGTVELQYGLPVKVGGRYLMFIHDWPAYSPGFPGFGGEVIARFELSDDDRVIPNGFEGSAGVRELSEVSPEDALAARSSPDPAAALAELAHVTLAEAVEKIKTSVAEAPIPEWPPEWSGLRHLYLKPTPIAASPAPAETPVPSPEPSSTPTPLASS